ncbi:MAG: hypothetical protein LLG08_03885 [Actinomycetia bacterium]|nr:hypothetical protein [Actinomycetes bacterium]
MNLFFSSLWRQPTPLELASSELEQAKRDLLATSSLREMYVAHEEMLVGRIERLRSAVIQLSQEEST